MLAAFCGSGREHFGFTKVGIIGIIFAIYCNGMYVIDVAIFLSGM
jgi:hypothetical protein